MTLIRKAVKDYSPHLIILGECFNSPYGPKYFAEYAEMIPNGFTCQELSKVAKECNVHIIGGSIPEKDADNAKVMYNTCTVWGPDGHMMDKHRKMHLYDVNMKEMQFKESSALTPGNKLTMVKVGPAKIGIGICFDIQFEEMARVYRNQGCNFLVYPSAFSTATGPMFWELAQKARALDSQCYVSMVSTARNTASDYVVYGHSMVVDPWTKVMKSAKDTEEVVMVDLGKDWNCDNV